MTWLAPQIAQYRQRHALGSFARLALELLLNIAARRHDAHAIGQQHIRDAMLCWRPHKTLRTTGKLLTIRIIVIRHAKLDADVEWAPWSPLHSRSKCAAVSRQSDPGGKKPADTNLN
jgi:hypothetical protein